MLAQMVQRFKKIWRRQGSASMFLAGGALLGGGAGFEQTKPPVMVSEVILMSKEEACPLRPSLKKCATRLTAAS